ncbi:MAG: hypothetical protein U5R48_17995 [Gammaproteobacteria bacterium]|nr:hypothetical protein [Gammaproteobacteria bacterium]
MVAGFHEPVRFGPGEARHWRLGGLDLFVRRMADGWLVQSRVGHSEEELDRAGIPRRTASTGNPAIPRRR